MFPIWIKGERTEIIQRKKWRAKQNNANRKVKLIITKLWKSLVPHLMIDTLHCQLLLLLYTKSTAYATIKNDQLSQAPNCMSGGGSRMVWSEHVLLGGG